MKRCVSMILVLLLLLSCMVTAGPTVHAAKKDTPTRAIAIVFDNSQSMYFDEGEWNKAWCRATYAMEVFASMLNEGDVLEIYPMSLIQVDGVEYTMNDPLRITSPSQASTIRKIFTPDASYTYINTIDCAAEGLQKLKADEKYLIVLTDGGTFTYPNSTQNYSKEGTVKALDERFEKLLDSMTVMYLGVGSQTAMPSINDSRLTKKQAADSTLALAALTEMCNQIFGRDVLPDNHKSGKKIDFDISMSKLIVFVQGEDIANLKVTNASGAAAGKLISTQQTMYSTEGCGDYKQEPVDTTLQGMMITYQDCAAGSYNIDFTGNASSIEVYYEPDVDLAFVFTDAEGNNVDPNALYEGDYVVSFGMMDGKTGKLISSDLLGKPHYEGSYIKNGQSYPITHDGHSGQVSVFLAKDDTFDANLKVTYLGGYTIRKTSADFGWPSGGIKVAPRPAGDFKLNISGGQDSYSLLTLEEGKPYIATLFYQGTQLTGDALKSVDLKWEPDSSNVEIKETFADDHYELTLHHKNPDDPQSTVCGSCTVSIYAYYTPQGSEETYTLTSLTYNVKDEYARLAVDLYASQDYIVINQIADTPAFEAKLLLNGKPLTAEEFAATKLSVDCGGIGTQIAPDPANSSYRIQLLESEGIDEGEYMMKVTATYTDPIGRDTQADSSIPLTLSNTPLWLKWLIGILLLLLLILLIIAIANIPAMPKKVITPANGCSLVVGPSTITSGVSFPGKRSGKQLTVQCRYNNATFGLSMKVKPAKGSTITTPHKRRSMVVQPSDISLMSVGVRILGANVNGVRFAVDPQTRKFGPTQANAKPITLRNGTPVKFEGKILVNGIEKNFNVSTKLEFRKK